MVVPAASMTSASSTALPLVGHLRLATALVAAVPFLAAVGARFQPERPASLTPAQDRAPLVFEQYLVNLGPVPSVREIGARYTFRNVGSRPLRITQLDPSCGCLNPQLEKKEYKPGETGVFFLKVQTAGQNPGPNEYTVRVRYEELDAAEASAARDDSVPKVAREPIELTFKMLIPEKQVSIRPRALVFYQLSEQETSQTVAVTDERERPLEIVAIKTSTPLVKAEIANSSTTDGVRTHLVRITVAGAVPPGRTRALVTLTTTDRSHPALQIPLMVQGRDALSAGLAQIHAEPPQLSFPTNAGLLTPPQDVVVTGVAGKPLEVTAVASESSVLKTKVIRQGADAEGRPTVRLRVQLAGIPGSHAFRDVVTLKTNQPEQPLLQVPVLVGGGVQQASGVSPRFNVRPASAERSAGETGTERR